MNKLTRLFLTGLMGITLGKASAQNYSKIEASTPDSSFQLEITAFQNYNPETSRKTIKLEDKLLEKYISTPTSVKDLGISISESGESFVKDKNIEYTPNLNNYKIKNSIKFEQDVLAKIDYLAQTDSTIKKISLTAQKT